MKIKSIFSLIFILSVLGISAQNEVEALRYSGLIYGGTARSAAIGGAFGALGGDFSSLSINPAGIGIYKGSEFSFTPNLYSNETSSSFMENEISDNKFNFNFNNIGLVLAVPGNGDWKYLQFGLGYNRLANYNQRYVVEGANQSNSLMDAYLLEANGYTPNQLNSYTTGLAFDTYLLDTVPGSTKQYWSPVPPGGIMQTRTKYSYGGLNEMVFTFGGNYNDKLYLGATLGLPSISYTEEVRYEESDVADTIVGFDKFSISDELKTRATGVNFKLGFIYRFNDYVRAGLALHTPTFYSFVDNYNRLVISHLETGNYDAKLDGEFQYKYQTPMRMLANFGFIIGKRGFISADFEKVNYSDARYSSAQGGAEFVSLNRSIGDVYTDVINYRFGGELNLQPIKLRAGYAYYASPYADDLNDGSKTIYSAGIGFREKSYFVDLTYQFYQMNEDLFLYNGIGEAANMEIKNQSFMFTVGFKF